MHAAATMPTKMSSFAAERRKPKLADRLHESLPPGSLVPDATPVSSTVYNPGRASPVR